MDLTSPLSHLGTHLFLQFQFYSSTAVVLLHQRNQQRRLLRRKSRHRPLYLDVEISSFSTQLLDEQSNKFNLDVSGPRLLFCADSSIDLLIKSGASQYVEFKSIDASFVGDESGKLWSVPDTRAAIFKDKSLSLMEKNRLMSHLRCASVTYFTPLTLSRIILYAIAMADYDQDNKEQCKDLLKTKDGIARLALYQSSVGRLTNAPGAFIYPIYGQGELPQAFCRRAAVKGCIYISGVLFAFGFEGLRMPVTSLLLEKSSGVYKGIRLASGQDIFSQKLVLDPSLTVPSPSASPLDSFHESFQFLCMRDVKQKITSIRALQISGNSAVCPRGMFVLYLSALSDDAHQGKKSLNAAMNALFTCPDSVNLESSCADQNENAELKPTLLWSALYIQELATGQFDSISSTPMPDGNLDYGDVLDSAMKLFQKMYPNEEFFPDTVEHDDGLSLEET
ncbi:hypothetical protein GH714_034890 [Hevea brasiliensis]|uniref:Rab proteins geranylgeranyltransferase component n=1 Tax=Hevea brasiliensis TaxID=3981 RepID=A0A6A6MFP1_HEVBR|nr:hypothetical protein GH714_034890 [Hevea brasiliensis]